MKRNKKIIIGVVSLIILLGTITFIVAKCNNKITYNKNGKICAAYIFPENLETLEDGAEIIVRGEFTGDRIADPDEYVIGPSTLSNVRIKESYKGLLNISDVVAVLEPFEIVENDFSNIEDYMPMNVGEEYILFLRENDTDYGKQYTITALGYGKYNVNNQDVILMNEEIEYLNEVEKLDFLTTSSYECSLYNEIKNEVNEKYIRNN